MKSLILATLVTITAAFAAGNSGYYPTADNSWEEIENNYKYRVETRFPSVNMDNGPFVNVDYLCYNGSELQTVGPISKCVEWRNIGRGDRECAERVEYTGYAAMTGTRTQCLEWRNLGRGERECAQYGEVPYANSLSHMVPVYKRRGMGRGEFEFKLLFKKEYTIPNCQ